MDPHRPHEWTGCPVTDQTRTWLRFLGVAAVLVLAAHTFDGWAYRNLVLTDVYEEDWGRMLRVMGFAPLWLLAAIAMVAHDWPAKGTERPFYHVIMRGWLLVAAIAASGIVGELLKLVFRRERPRAHDGEYFFRAFSERPLHSGGLALPSTHAIVAFGAATMLARLFPRARFIWYGLAVGCGLTRVLTQAHFVSDVAVAGLVAWAITAWLWKRHEARLARMPAHTPA
jgi:membrane-associated phospholipid phosphatase